MEGTSNYVIVMNRPQLETLTKLLTTNGLTLTTEKISEASDNYSRLKVEAKNNYNENLLLSKTPLKKKFLKDSRNHFKLKYSKGPSVSPSIKNNFKLSEENRTLDRNDYISSTFADLAKLLSEAASQGDHKEVCKLLANGASVHSFGPVNMNPLHLAAMNGHLKVCRILLNSGVFIDASNKLGKTALHLAAVGGHTKVVKYLLVSGALVDPIDMLEMTPLHWACDRGHTTVVKHLLWHNADPNRCNKFEKSPLQLAYEKNSIGIINLIEKGVSDFNDDEVSSSSSSDVKEQILDSSFVEDLEGDSFNIQEVTGNAKNFEEITSQDSENTFEDLPEVFSEDLTPEVLNEEIIQADEIEDLTEDIDQNIITEDDLNDSPSDYDEYEDRKQDSLLRSIEELEKVTFNNAKSPKLVKDYEDCLREATALLRAQTALISLEDPSQMLQRAIMHGHTIQLTEAGEKALAMIKPESFILPTHGKRRDKEDEEEDIRRQRTNKGRTNNVTPQSYDVGPAVSSSNSCNALVLRNEMQDYLLQPTGPIIVASSPINKPPQQPFGQWKTATEPPVKKYKI